MTNTIIRHNGWLLSVPSYRSNPETHAGRKRERILRDFMTASEQSAKMHMIATMRARQDFPKMSLSAKFYQEEAAYWHSRACAHREAFNNVKD